MARLKNGRAPLVFEDGAQSRDFVHVRDVADAVVRAAEGEGPLCDAVNVCTGRPIAIGEVALTRARRLGVELPPQFMGKYRAGDIRYCIGDPKRARELLGFEARTDFAGGLDGLPTWSAQQRPQDRLDASMAQLQQQGLVR